ncbi:glycoside hydrolase family 3 N-terminal domain-containing protein [Micrococcus terreus]|uniref:beta-N-acetylhexosaminidase n=1 Tax=Micrococcus terreus TaxID=574650 RepID=A0A1I7ME74_9MICC|nr:beta-N-acetylhexosaminidase [Micrococcus terreus]
MTLPRTRVLSALSLSTLLLLTGCTAPGGQSPSTSVTGGTGSAGQSGEGPSSGSLEEEPQTELERLLAAGPDEELRSRAAEAVAQMSLDQKAGQVLVGQLGAAGTSPEELERLHLGGVIVMGDAVPTSGGEADLEALSAELTAVQEALQAGRDWSGVVAVDQEGGLVARVKAPLTEWPTPMSYGAAPAGAGEDAEPGATAELTRDGHRLMGAELAELGFTVDFAPSVDVTVGAADPAIGARSFSSDPEAVAALGAAGQQGLLQAGVLASPKHFPGHGSVEDDSHVTMPEQVQSVDELLSRDWAPFQDLIAASHREEQYAPMMMMGHLDVPELDPGVPSSVSSAAYQALRGLGDADYDGVVVTDALNMGALVERFGPNEAPVRALAAGADLLLMPSNVVGAHGALVSAVQDGEVPEERLTEAAERVVTMLMWRDAVAGEVASSGPDEAARADQGADAAGVSEQVSASAITVVDGVCGESMVTDSLQIRGGDETDRMRLADAAQEAGLTLGSGPVVTLVGSARGAAHGDVVVALDAPFGLAESRASEDGALVALYGRTPGAFAALVDVLTGEAEAPGALPVQVGDWPAGTGC